MTRRVGVFFLTFLVGFYLVDPAPAQNASTTNSPKNVTSRRRAVRLIGEKARELFGKKIENMNGELLGTFKSLIVDTQSARVDYVVISTGGFAGIGAQLKVAPPEVVSPATAKRDTLAMDISLDRWRNSPVFKKDQMARLADPVQAGRIYQFYKQQWSGLGEVMRPPGTPTPTGRAPRSQLTLASEVIGKRVITPQKQNQGKISDLLVDLPDPSKAALALFRLERALAGATQPGNELFAIPVSAFRLERRENRLLLDITPTQFQEAPRFNPANWPPAGGAGGAVQIFRYQISNK